MQNIDLNIELLRCFLAVAECKSFTTAGARLHRSQSAISIRIQKLEELLGQRLFERTSRSVRLNQQGEQLLPYAKKMLATNDELVNTLCTPELSGRLRIGVVEYLAPQRLPLIVTQLRRQYPKIRLEIKLALSRELLKALDANEIDVVIAKRDDRSSDGETLFSEQLHWVSSASAPERSEPILPLCLLPAPCYYRASAVQTLSEAGRVWSEALTATSIYGVQLAVESGVGITVLGASAITSSMTIISRSLGLPQLPSIEIAVFGISPVNKALITPFIEHLRREQVSSIVPIPTVD